MKYIIGNLIDFALDGQFDVIAHGCNCFKNFGAGIALEIKNRIPQAYNADIRHSNPSLGNYSQVVVQTPIKRNDEFIPHDLVVVNCYSQHFYGKPYSETNKTKYSFDTAEARYDAIRSCMSRLKSYCLGLIDENGDNIRMFSSGVISKPKIGLPLIGCGLAGLEWKTVEKIIQEELNLMDVTVVVFNESERLKNNITLTQ